MISLSDLEAPRVFPTFRYQDADAMIDWLANAFGFAVQARHDGEDGSVAHAQLSLGSSMIMLGSARDDTFGAMVGIPGKDGGKSVYLAVDDANAAYEKAKAAGATILEEPVDRDYGSREFICRDPEGNLWCLGTYWPKVSD